MSSLITCHRRCSYIRLFILCVFSTVLTIFFTIHNTGSKHESSSVQGLGIDATSGRDHHRHRVSKDNATYIRLKSIFQAGRWKSDFVSPHHHKHYDVNCSAILSGDHLAIDAATKLAKGPVGESSVEVPSDEEVGGWTSDCDAYQKSRNYPTKSESAEEEDYPIAYIFTLHKDAAQVERLFRAIYAPQNTYCFHVDKKAPQDFHLAIQSLTNCFDNAFLATTLEDVQYGGFTRLKADLNCMSDLLSHKWKYVLNVCGQDFPLKTNREIVWQLKALNGKNDIPGVYPEQSKWFVGRTRYHHEYIEGEMRKTNQRKPPPPHDALMYFGNAYIAAKREFVEYVLTDQIAIDLLNYLSDSQSPDEHYWVTVNKYPGAPGGFPHSTWASSIRFVKWTNSDEYAPCVGKFVRAVCIIGTGYLPYISTRSQLFMNKIHYDYDPIPLQCMEELLNYRTKVPGSIDEFVSEYPVTNLFDISPDRKPESLYRFMGPTKIKKSSTLPVVFVFCLLVFIMFVICMLLYVCACICAGACEEQPNIKFKPRRQPLGYQASLH